MVERLEDFDELRSVLFLKVEIKDTQMLEVGEDRAVVRVEERGESAGADEVLGECTAHPSVLSEDEVLWFL